MFRFIWNFIFFGIIFYLIFHFLPQESTDALVSWMDSLFDGAVDLGKWAVERISALISGGS